MADVRSVDINADAGEGLDDEVLMPYLTSVSVACGGHAGDRESMARTLSAARRHGLRAGAHPGYPDRAGFGRVEVEIGRADLQASLLEQLATLRDIAVELGVRLTHVKAHGALYNRAWRDPETAAVIAGAVAAFDPGCAMFCPHASAQAEAARSQGLAVVREVFLDRRYRPDGTLVPRGEAGDIVAGRQALAGQVASLAGLEFDTMCVHGDNPAALELLQALPDLLAGGGWQVAPYAIAG